MQWKPSLPLLDRLRSTWVQTIHHEQTSGFLGQDASVEHREVAANPDGEEAARMIEDLRDRIEKLSLYVAHEVGCRANDLDYLDRSPCTCGLRMHHNPKGQRDEPAQAA